MLKCDHNSSQLMGFAEGLHANAENPNPGNAGLVRLELLLEELLDEVPLFRICGRMPGTPHIGIMPFWPIMPGIPGIPGIPITGTPGTMLGASCAPHIEDSLSLARRVHSSRGTSEVLMMPASPLA